MSNRPDGRMHGKNSLSLDIRHSAIQSRLVLLHASGALVHVHSGKSLLLCSAVWSMGGTLTIALGMARSSLLYTSERLVCDVDSWSAQVFLTKHPLTLLSA